MPNTVTNTRIIAGTRRVIQYITIASDGSEETDLVLYDSSAVATAVGKTDPLNSRIKAIKSTSSSAAGVYHLEWDATTDVLAMALPFGGHDLDVNYECFGGLKNTAGTGITGDITLTTTGLAAGDSLTIILEVDPEYPSNVV